MNEIDLKGCERALVYGTNNKMLSNARVLDTGFSVYLFLDNPNLRPAHISVYVDFYKSTQGILRCWCELVISKNQQVGNAHEVWAAKCKVLSLVKTIQRQKNLRVRVNIPIIYSTEYKPIMKGVIKNISAGGIYLISNEILKNGTKISYEHMLDGRLCGIKAQVVYGRVIPDAGVYRYGYGCSFYNLSEQTANTVRLWCHNHQERKMLD